MQIKVGKVANNVIMIEYLSFSVCDELWRAESDVGEHEVPGQSQLSSDEDILRPEEISPAGRGAWQAGAGDSLVWIQVSLSRYHGDYILKRELLYDD